MVRHGCEGGAPNILPCKEYNIATGERTAQFPAKGAKAAFCAVAPHGVSQLLTRNKSNTTGLVVLILAG